MSRDKLHPLVLWAQREKILYLRIEINDLAKLEVNEKAVHVKGKYGGSETEYEASIELFDDVKADYRQVKNDRLLELIFTKEKPGWWPRLLKAAIKPPWVKVDFDKWVDEDETDEEEDDYAKYMRNLDGGDASIPNLDDMDDDDDDDDGIEGMPDLEDIDDEGENIKKKEEKEPVKVGNNENPIDMEKVSKNNEMDKLDSEIGAETLKTA